MSKTNAKSVSLKTALTLGVGMTAMFSAATPLAFAQDGEEASRKLKTVTVTATKREQTLQDIPVAVSVVDAETIEKAQIVDILDLQSAVPTLRVGQFQQAGNASFSIRGFGNGANNIGIEPAVAVFIDGVYRTRAAGGLSDYADISRIEVLRGPQSTLFGKNASVGLISVSTKEPEYEFGGNLEATLGNYNSQILKGRLTGPLSDKAAFSISGSSNTRDGYADNIELGTELNDRDRSSIKGQLLIEPTENLKIRLIADYDELEETCCYTPNIINGPTAGAIALVGGQVIGENPFGFETALDVDPTNVISNSGVSGQIDWETPFGTVTSITSSRKQDVLSDGDVDFTSLQAIQENILDYDIETFTQEFRLAGSTEKLDYLVGAFYFDESVDQFGNVLYDTAFYDYANVLAGGAIPLTEGVLGVAPRTFFAPGTGSEENFSQDNTSYSLFGQFDFQFSDKLTATIGAAYINDEKTVTGAANSTDAFAAIDLGTAFNNVGAVDRFLQATEGITFADFVSVSAYEAVTMTAFDPAAFGALQVAAMSGDPTALATLNAIGGTAANPAFQAGVQQAVSAGLTANFAALSAFQFLPPFLDFPNAVEGDSTNDSQTTYTARLAYDATDNLNVYASYATGFKASSWNLTRDSSYFSTDAADLATAGLIPNNRGAGTRFAGPEETTTFEIGAKFATSDFNLNVAYFDQTVEGFQSTIFQGTGFVLSNAGEQATKGLEWDATWVPTDELTLVFAGIVQDPEYVEFTNAPGPNGTVVDLSGTQPAGISETSLYAAAQFDFNVTDTIEGFARADWQHESEVQVVDNIAGVDREVNTINASLGLTWDNDLSVTLWGRNLNDDEYFQSAFPTVAQAGSVNGYPNAPKTYGVTVRKSF